MPRVKCKCYLLADGKVIRVGVRLEKKFPKMANSKAILISAFGLDDGLSRLDFDWAYFDQSGAYDFTYHHQEASQRIDEVMFGKRKATGKVIQLPVRVKKPNLSPEEKALLLERLVKDYGNEQLDTIKILLNQRPTK
ncbi:hypothetical protein Dred_0526 [Desulforamulus reducens MI-1]|uniref:Uncharacterized protein n=1 Tax=Desulforamulus reducens (strain ATCC BAA-1160 / DSM 100696 / MI-1) TaxID=349161 RepID=A4J1W8_DESRM|nr:hypothetical protein [Desulforamulus reducens]ABO49071.1 hypothetical protein Dred_0526 [Desulforamulus reducens MI-1]